MFDIKKYKTGKEIETKFPKVEAYVHRYIALNGNLIQLNGIGSAKCDKGDQFDMGFGIELSTIRANIAMLKDFEDILIDLTKQPEWRKEKTENKSTTLKELVGKWAIRTKSPEGITDTSFCSDPVYVRKVTDTHAIYTMQNFLDSEHLLTGKWLDNNWIDYDKLMSKE